jgi:predicted amidohydrolase YtcJ
VKTILLKTAGLAAGLALALAASADKPADMPPGHTDPDVVLINGNIHTMDADGSIARGVGIKDGRLIEVTNGRPHTGPRTKVIDLQGRTVVPGMIEGHVHFVSLAIRPGYHVVIENAQSIAEIQAMLAARRADVPPGQFITAMGGWHPNMFAEHRLPTLAELDAAVPDRPVFVFQQFSGPARTNTLGKAFFEHPSSPTPTALPLLPVTVGSDGSMAGLQATTALYDLRVLQSFDDKKRSTVDAMRYAASVGITAVLDEVGFPDSGPLAPTQILANFDNFHMYDSWLAVRKDGNALIRLQANFLHNQNDITLPELTQRLKNQFQLFGDDMMMTGAIGEWGAPGDGVGDVWLQAQRLVGQAGWRNNNRALSLASFAAEVAGYEAINGELIAAGHPDGITKWRWRIDHVPVVTTDLLSRLEALGGAVQMGAFSYVSGRGPAAGAPFRSILAFRTNDGHAIKAGIHLDGVHIAPLNPWFGVYYASTGKNALGQLINDGQQISREQAVRLYTRENAWFLNMEDRLGSIEAGKLADLVVLNDDYTQVSDEGLKRIGSVLTLVNGKVVHDSGVLSFDRD